MNRIHRLACSAAALTLASYMLPAIAADDGQTLQQAMVFTPTPDHLLPLDGRGIDLYSGYEKFLEAVAPRHDNIQSSVYIWPAFRPAIFLGIYQTEDEKSYYLIYALAIKSKPTVSTVSIPESFAKQFTDRLEQIVRASTHYETKGPGLILCTDATEYVFESNNYYGAAGCPVTGAAQQLEAVAEDLVALAELGSVHGDQQDIKMKAILSELDTVMGE